MSEQPVSATWTDADIDGHAALLAERVFQIDTKWPHFRLLLKNIRELAKRSAPGDVVVSLERTLLYGGHSLIGPFFRGQHFVCIDGSPPSAEAHGAYNKSMLDDERFLSVSLSVRASDLETGLESCFADLVLVPNLVHHTADQHQLFKEVARITKPGGKVYVFEPLVRELHQIPDDFLRYTPFGLQRALRAVGLSTGEYELEGGPFSAIAYCWTQALEYFPDGKRQEMERWFYDHHFPELIGLDERFPDNLVRQRTKFPMSFSVLASKAG